ncbi:MAG: hypothetical protein F4X92_08000 [Gammaproteobacteria bacterium]|nr:hypothetical protein [Gammaproteobacteria bacterium]
MKFGRRGIRLWLSAMACSTKTTAKRDIGRCSGYWILFVCLAFISTGDAKATTLEEAETAYAEGRYLEAARMAEKAGGASGFALAANSLNTHALYYAEKDEQSGLFRHAMDLAERAIEIDPKSLRGHFELVRAMGKYAQGIGRVKAMNEKYAEQIREHLEFALSLDDNFADAHLALGSWHAGLVEVMGSFLAGILFGANRKDAVFHIERALDLDREGIDIHYGSANGFLALGKRKYRKKAEDLLSRVAELPVQESYQASIQEKAVQRIKELNSPKDTNSPLNDR